MEQQTPTPTGTAPVTWVVAAAAIVLLGLFGAGVALAYAGWKPESIAGLLTAVGTVGAGLLVALGKLLTDINRKVEQVVHQTNGAQRTMVEDVLRAELDARGIGQQPATRSVTKSTRGRPTR